MGTGRMPVLRFLSSIGHLAYHTISRKTFFIERNIPQTCQRRAEYSTMRCVSSRGSQMHSHLNNLLVAELLAHYGAVVCVYSYPLLLLSHASDVGAVVDANAAPYQFSPLKIFQIPLYPIIPQMHCTNRPVGTPIAAPPSRDWHTLLALSSPYHTTSHVPAHVQHHM